MWRKRPGAVAAWLASPEAELAKRDAKIERLEKKARRLAASSSIRSALPLKGF
jgi:hypothetical protein